MRIRNIAITAVTAVGLWGQGSTFEVASIKPAAPLNPKALMMGQQRLGMKVDAARVDIANLTLEDLIRIAYSVKTYQIVGPEWLKGQRWNVVAKMPEGASPDQAPQMLQALLADRFKLAVHRETKEHAVYALVVGKNGPKMKAVEDDAAPQADAGKPGAAGGGAMSFGLGTDAKGAFLSSGKLGEVRVEKSPVGAAVRLHAERASMAALVEMLSRMVDRPVVDMTGLKGTYQIAVDLSLEDLRNMAAAAGVAMPAPHVVGSGAAPGGRMEQGPEPAGDDAGGSSIFASVQQLGLKLEARKAPIETIVVDHVEKEPTEN